MEARQAQEIRGNIDRILKKVASYNKDADLSLIERAFETARLLHGDQVRKSGEPFVTHPLSVAEILADLHLDTTSIVAALLHDSVEDTKITIDQIKTDFGDEIADIVDGVTKLEKIKFKSREEHQAESLRKMLLAMTRDVRVILIKIADRLHNMRTISSTDLESQREKAQETLEIYAPFAHRFGMSQIKWELEDLALSVLEPERYAQIQGMVNEKREERENYIREVCLTLLEELKKTSIAAEVSGRPKHFYSIYKKMIQRGKEFNEIYDLSGLRVLTNSVKECYGALGVIHSLWTPIPGRFKDYIAMPKFNMYQSLHTTVIGPAGRPLEIQIRTKQMHQTSEYGIAAHWKYKEGRTETESFHDQFAWFSQMMEWQKELKDPREFMQALKIELFQEEVFVFTPNGDVQSLPVGSTPVDFAFAIHTEVGSHCVGARVNNHIVPLDYRLRNGDFVEILTSKQAKPSKDWLKFVKTTKARNKIKQWYTKELKEDSEHEGREMLQRVLRKHDLTIASVTEKVIEEVGKEFNFHKLADVYAAIGAGTVSPKQITTKLINRLAKEEKEKPFDIADLEQEIKKRSSNRKRSRGSGIKVEGGHDVLVRLAQCCSPVPFDEITGFITQGRGISVHRADCQNVRPLLAQPERIIQVAWDKEQPALFPVELQIEALDRTKLLRDISATISDLGINIQSASVSTNKNHEAIFRFAVEIPSLSSLGPIITEIKKIDAVRDVFRVTRR